MPAVLGRGQRGLVLENRDILCINRTGATLTPGDCLKLDVTVSDGSVADNDIGQTDSGLANVVDLASDNDLLCVIALEATVDDAVGKFRIAGHVQANIDGASTTIGVPLMPYLDSENKLGLKADGGSCVAMLLVASGGSDAVREVMFDGIHGFGGYDAAI